MNKVKQALHERLGLSADQQATYLSEAWQAYEQRRDEHGDRNSKQTLFLQQMNAAGARARFVDEQISWEELYKAQYPELYEELSRDIGCISLPEKAAICRLSGRLRKAVPEHLDAWTSQETQTYIKQLQEECEARRRSQL